MLCLMTFLISREQCSKPIPTSVVQYWRRLYTRISETTVLSPYIQLHEFEALILADPKKLDWEYMGIEIEDTDALCRPGLMY